MNKIYNFSSDLIHAACDIPSTDLTVGADGWAFSDVDVVVDANLTLPRAIEFQENYEATGLIHVLNWYSLSSSVLLSMPPLYFILFYNYYALEGLSDVLEGLRQEGKEELSSQIEKIRTAQAFQRNYFAPVVEFASRVSSPLKVPFFLCMLGLSIFALRQVVFNASLLAA